MNVIQAIQFYINNMVSIQGMKVFLLDTETTRILSMVYTQSQILQKEVFLFEKLEQPGRETMGHLKAIVFVRPTEENIRLLRDELKEPKYGEYHIFFSNIVKNVFIEELAQADEHEAIKQVQEYFADYYAINTDLFSLNQEGVFFSDSQLNRTIDGIVSVLLSLKKKPSVRYQKKSQLAYRVSQELTRRINQESELFYFHMDTPPLLLILDRRDDPITPLLMQWTYQAMTHELLGITNNRVDLKHLEGVRKEMQEVVLSPESDPFYKQHVTTNYGDLGEAVKALVDEYSAEASSHKNIQSVDDMKRFVENYEGFRKKSNAATKHVTLLSELNKNIDKRSLMEVSELEQELACNNNANEAFTRVASMIENPRIDKWDKLKLVILYSLKYEEGGRVGELTSLLSRAGLDQNDIYLVSAVTQYAAVSAQEKATQNTLLGGQNIMEHLQRAKANIQKGFQGVVNIYAQHKPVLSEILDQVSRNKLKETVYPYLSGQATPTRPTDVIVLILGGVTYEEAFFVTQFNSQFGASAQANKMDRSASMRVVLGGTTIHNSHSFLKDVGKFAREGNR